MRVARARPPAGHALLVLLCVLGCSADSVRADEPEASPAPANEPVVHARPDGTFQWFHDPRFRNARELSESMQPLLQGEGRELSQLEVSLERVLPIVIDGDPPARGQPPPTGGARLVLSAKTREAVLRGRAWLLALDRPHPQVGISMLIIEVRRSAREGYGSSLLFDKRGRANPDETIFRGISHRFDAGGFLASSLSGTRPFEGTVLNFADPNTLGAAWESTLLALQKSGEAHLVAWPDILCTEGVPSTLSAVANLPHTLLLSTRDGRADVGTVNEAIGLKLGVTAHRVAREHVDLQLDVWLRVPEATERDATATDGLVFKTRQLRTRVTVRDGEPLLVGGVYLHRGTRDRQGIPVAPALAMVGALPGSYDGECERTELLFLLRAHVHELATPPGPPPPTDPCAVPERAETTPRGRRRTFALPWERGRLLPGG